MFLKCLTLLILTVGCSAEKVSDPVKGAEIKNPTATVENKDVPLFRFQDPKTKLYGFKDSNGNVVLPAKYAETNTTTYENCDKFPEDALLSVRLEDPDATKVAIEKALSGKTFPSNIENSLLRWFRINKKGEIIEQTFALNHWMNSSVINGLIPFVENGKIGFSTKEGKHVIPAQFDFASSFFKEYALVGMECEISYQDNRPCAIDRTVECKRYGAINKKGEPVIPITYDKPVFWKKEKKDGSVTLVIDDGEGFRKERKCFQIQKNSFKLKERACPPPLPNPLIPTHKHYKF